MNSRLLILISLILLVSMGQASTLKQKLTVKLENTKVKKGKFYVAIYKSKEDFENEKMYKSIILNHNVKSFSVMLNKGTYSIILFQDINGDQCLNTILGIPREPYGLSNNPKGFPKWENTVFNLESSKVINIKIIF